MQRTYFKSLIVCLCFACLAFATSAQEQVWRHAGALVGEVKYPKDFPHFDYVNPNAPKGGALRLSAGGTFDNLNPIPPKGELALGLSLVAETLLTSSMDEISTEYGLLAEAFSYPEDYSSVTYRLRENAKWHDGMPVTPEDVIFSFESAIAHNPTRQDYYKNITSAEKTGPRDITFTFDQTGNRELPKIVGQLLIMPKHWWEGTDADGNPRDISATTLEPILGSGPYKISSVNPGGTMRFERVTDYWGEDLNVNVGQNNFDQISYLYFLDRNVAFEGFKGDEFDYWSENIAKRWATGYDFPAFNEGKIKREQLPNAYRRSGIFWGFLPNLRLDKFKDARVRRALNFAYDFEEDNKTLFYDSYKRIDSYFFGTELASSGLPTGRELEILEEYRGRIPDEVFTTAYQNPVGGEPQKVRSNLREAVNLFKAAGYDIQDGQMINLATGEPFTFEILLRGPALEKIALRYAENLKRIGVEMSIRTVDDAQWGNRWRERDFDMIYYAWGQSLSPGNEQISYWGSEAADQNASGNYMGIKDAAIDDIIDRLIFAKDRDELVTLTKVLDRVLLANHFATPSYTLRASRIAYWDRFEHPDELPTYSIGFPTVWWSKQAQ